jgi:hypothetical protein
MKLMALGLDYPSGEPLYHPIDELELARLLETSLPRFAGQLSGLARANTLATLVRGEVERVALDPGNPRTAGWTFLLNAKDPNKEQVIEAIRPLAQWRGMTDPQKPFFFNDEPSDVWFDWLRANLDSPDLERVPQYLLILGGPDRIPFQFQALLSTILSVGRLAFDDVADVQTYVDKILRLEQVKEPVVARKAIFFGTDGGFGDPTYYSRSHMVEPLATYVTSDLKIPTKTMVGVDATKERLATSLAGERPSLIYTASHGAGSPTQPLAVQRRINGAICCQQPNPKPKDDSWLFAAADVPTTTPFLEGAIFFQFACFGYGTPARSGFAHWVPNIPATNAESDFMSALPARLLAHPRGPIAYVGHVDTAWLHGFDDPKNPGQLTKRWNDRMSPFRKAVTRLLATDPVGLAMKDMGLRYGFLNSSLATYVDHLNQGTVKLTPQSQSRLATDFVTRNDAQNYLILGDPAARVRIPDDDGAGGSQLSPNPPKTSFTT